MRYKERNRDGEMGWRGAERVGVHVFVRVCVYVCECKHMYIYTTCVCVCVEEGGGGGGGNGGPECIGKRFTLWTYDTKLVSVPLCQHSARGGWPGHNQQTLLQL